MTDNVQTKKWTVGKIIWTVIGGLIALSMLSGFLRGVSDGARQAVVNNNETTQSAPVEQAPAEPTETLGQENARKSAESYLRYSSFSREGLLDQLDYEGYSKADAEYAVDNVEVDWFEEAAESAETYLKYSSFSKKELLDQLDYEGFTKEQAAFGVKSVGY